MVKIRTEYKNICLIDNGWFCITLINFKKSFIKENIIFENTANIITIEKDLQKIETSNVEEISDSLVTSYLTTNLWD